MARYALICDEINDYVSLSNTNLGAATSADMCFGTFIRIPSNTGALFKYFVSNGAFSAANKVNVFVLEDAAGTDSNKLRITTNNGEGTTSISFDWTVEKCVIIERVSGAWAAWIGDSGGTLTKYPLHTDTESLSASGWQLNRRADGNADRYFGGEQSRFFFGSRGLTQTEADDIANGSDPSVIISADIVCNYLYDEGTGNTIFDSESAAAGTLNNYPVDDSQWLLVDAGSGAAVQPTAATTETTAPSPGVSSGASLSPTAASTESFSPVPSISAGASVFSTAAITYSFSPDPAITSGASVNPDNAVTATFSPDPSVTATDPVIITPTVATTYSLSLDPGVASGASLSPTAAQTTTLSYDPVVGVVVAVNPTTAVTESDSLPPVISSGASVSVDFATTLTEAYNPTIGTYGVVNPTAAYTASESLSPEVIAGVEEFVRSVQIDGVLITSQTLSGTISKDVTISGININSVTLG